MKTVFIYALKDPRDGAVRYIGKTETPKGRMRAHLRSKQGSHKAHWILQLKALGVVPEMEILDEVPDSQWEFFERAYIKVYKEFGACLTNMTPGGDICGPLFLGHKHSEDSKRRISEGVTGNGLGVPKTPEHRAKLSRSLMGVPHEEGRGHGHGRPKGFKISEEQKKAISAAQTGRIHSPEEIAKGIAKRTGQKRTPEQRARMSAGMTGIKRTPEGCSRISEAKKGRPWTEKQRASFEKRKAEKNV